MKLNRILDAIENGHLPSGDDVELILNATEPSDLERLFERARRVRETYFENRIFLYGFLYTSTFCRNNCHFCFYRADNRLPERYRYRKTSDEILSSATLLAESGVHLLDLTMGEDPHLFKGDRPDFLPLIQLVKEIKAKMDLPVMVSPGVVPGYILEQLVEAGVTWYACYQETHTPELYNRLRPGQDFGLRLSSKLQARNCGMLTEDGILLGVGETAQDIAHSFKVMRSLGVSQVRAMNFVPQQGTPMADTPPPHPLKELIVIALLRLIFPKRLIPATLDVEGLDGLKRRLDAGANVVTSIVPPRQGLAGVAQTSLDIDDSRRTTENVKLILQECGLESAELSHYKEWLKKS